MQGRHRWQTPVPGIVIDSSCVPSSIEGGYTDFMESRLSNSWKRTVVIIGLGFALTQQVSAGSETSAAPTDRHALVAVGSLDGAVRPDGVPLDYVIAPIGYFSPSCIVGVEENETVDESSSSISRSDGSQRPMPVCTHPYYKRTGKTATGKPVANEVVYPDHHHTDLAGNALPLTTVPAGTKNIPVVNPSGGFGTWYDTAATSPPGRLITSWTVPPKPTADITIFYWPAFNGGVVQPVLGWENLGWTLSSWYCCTNGAYVHGAFFATAPGHHAEGDIYSSCPPGTAKCSGWVVTTRDITTGQVSVIKWAGAISGSTEVIGMTVESYAGANCTAYPPNGSFVFHDIVVYDNNFNVIASPPWKQTGTDGCLATMKPIATLTKLTYGAPQ
jgi:hypothetical protein